LKLCPATISEEKCCADFFHDWMNFGVTRCVFAEAKSCFPIMPDSAFFEYVPINEIPKHCPYTLEHVVSMEEAHAK
jgi:hypothetical protein